MGAMPDDTISSPTISATGSGPRRRHRRLRAGSRDGPRRAMGRAPLGPRPDPLVDERARPGRDRRAPRLARRPGPLRRPGRRPRGVRRGDPRRRVHDRGGRRDGRQQPRPGGLPPDLRDARRAGSTCASSTRPTRRPWPRPSTTSIRSQTLWIVASKSGTTTEPLAFLADAWDRAEAALGPRAPRYEHAGELIVAITDPGKSVEAIPHHDDLREVFLNPPDIGGRYSALTYVGLVPAQPDRARPRRAPRLGRGDGRRLPRAAIRRRTRAVSLGLAIGTLAQAGRDKLTFVADPAIDSFGAWAEQLIAESTGKHGTGIVPIDREPLGAIEAYGHDRVFVRLSARRRRGDCAAGDALVDAAAAAGHPVIRIALADPIDLGAEAFRWEVATAIAGAVLGIDPFDQPNVEEAKELTRKVLAAAEPARPAPPPRAARRDAATGLTLHGDAALRLTAGDGTLVGELARHLARRKPNAYLALQAFIAPSAAARRRARRGSGPSCATRPAARRRPATGRGSSTRPASSTRAARRAAGSCSSPPTTRWTGRSPAGRTPSAG